VQKLVNRVNTLVHQRATAVERPGASPGPGIIVFLCAPPFDVRGGRGHSAKAVFIAGLFQGFDGDILVHKRMLEPFDLVFVQLEGIGEPLNLGLKKS
jgi:hypothetical protein